ncbi:hypothetical protein OM076_08025 [Solirubrobacter ginsenosidimutans]|uniref:Uncharacterized protein n=1 Tax=Solirubrobacter ginsenosidimutans TaxID=490573 RepID=A0A9X3MP45_9ACTN|nr:hypothetical protein [Solirubrobacter ginsenosidimutans]MDA0160206.1 hypothetical protein [Solirubrobacter ginsenosidimutans]
MLDQSPPSRLERLRQRRRDRKQRRAWRRERRKVGVDLHDASTMAESSQFKSGFFTKK